MKITILRRGIVPGCCAGLVRDDRRELALRTRSALQSRQAVAPRGPVSVPMCPEDLQYRTISEAARAGPGDTVVIHDGIYLQNGDVEKSGTAERPIHFVAAPAARVIIAGADVITGMGRGTPAASVFSAPWPHRFIGWNKTRTHPDDDHHA